MEIVIKTRYNTIELVVEPETLVSDVKKKLAIEEGIYPNETRLIFGGKELDDTKTMDDYDIQRNSIFNFGQKLTGFKLEVKDCLKSDSDGFIINVEPGTFVSEIKAQIYDEISSPSFFKFHMDFEIIIMSEKMQYFEFEYDEDEEDDDGVIHKQKIEDFPSAYFMEDDKTIAHYYAISKFSTIYYYQKFIY